MLSNSIYDNLMIYLRRRHRNWRALKPQGKEEVEVPSAAASLRTRRLPQREPGPEMLTRGVGYS